MKLHRFLLDKNIKQPLGEEIKVEEKALLHQWNNVLKFKKGEKISFFDGNVEKDFIYTIKDINKKFAIFEFYKEIKNFSQKKEINLCISVVKKEKMALIIEKCTEIGVSNFISIISERVEKKNINSFNIEKLTKVAKEAVEQSGFSFIPTITEPLKLEKLIKKLENEKELEKVVILDTFESKNVFLDLKDLKKFSFKYIFIGPEGGWSDKEVSFFKEKNLNFINFGQNVLRTETAAIVSTFLISL